MSQGQYLPPAGSFGAPTISPTAKDESDLNTLSILHYVWSGLIGCSTLGMIAYFVLFGGLMGVTATSSGAPAGGAALGAGIVIVFALVLGAVMVALFVMHIMAAAGLKQRKRRMLTFVSSAFMCTSFPLGTALGVWTIMVLSRPGVKALYGEG